jgi:hypothetical protein
MLNLRQKVTIGTSVAIIGIASPIVFSPARGLEPNNAGCQASQHGASFTGTCCLQCGSICNAGGGDNHNYYYKAEGACSGIPVRCGPI